MGFLMSFHGAWAIEPGVVRPTETSREKQSSLRAEFLPLRGDAAYSVAEDGRGYPFHDAEAGHRWYYGGSTENDKKPIGSWSFAHLPCKGPLRY